MPSNAGYAVLQVIPSVRGISEELRRQLVAPAGDAGDRAGRAAGSELKDKVRAGAAAAGVAAGALLAAGIVKAIDRANIASSLQAQLGSTNKVAAQHGKIAGKLYSTAVAGSFQDAADAIKSVVQGGLAPPGTTTRQLQQIATKASDVATVFGQDLGGVTNAVSQLLRTGLAPNATVAFDILTKGFQSGADKAGDLLDTVNEYSVQFRKAGLDGATALGLIDQAIQAGARDSDIAADALKEFSIRAVDGSTTTAGGFKMLGLNADDMAARFAKGGSAANAVLDVTLDRLRGIKDPVVQAQAAVALFGTQAEDLGRSLLVMDPSTAAKSLGDFGGAANQLGKTIRSGPSYEIEVFKRTLELGFVAFIGGRVLPLITTVATWFNAHLLPPIRAVAVVVASVLVPALTGLWRAGTGVVGWLRSMGTWLIPVSVALAGLTVAVNAERIAVLLTTAVLRAYRAATLAWATVTRGAAVAQGVFNAVMSANPIILVITAIIALGAALVVAYRRSATFRGIVLSAWNGIRAVVSVVWATVLKPVFNALAITVRTVGSVLVWLWRTVVSPVFGFIGAALKVLFVVWAIVAFGPIVLAVKALAVVVRWLWSSAIHPTFRLIGALAVWLYGSVIKPQFLLVQAAIRALGAVFRWLYTSIVRPVCRMMLAAVTTWWSGTKVVFHAVVTFLSSTLGPTFRWLYTSVVKPAWSGIRSTISSVWSGGILPAFDALRKGVGKVADAFKSAKNAIATAWKAIEQATKTPINWVLRVVWNEGIVSVWKKITGWIPGVPQLKKLPLLAGGGALPAQPGVFNQPTAIVGEGRAQHPEYVIPTDPRYRQRALALHAAAGAQLLESGGVLGGLKKLRGAVKGAVTGVVDFFEDPIGAAAKLLDPVLGRLDKLTGTTWGKAMAGLPRMAVKGLKDLVKNAVGSFFGGGATNVGGSGVTRWTPLVRQVLSLLGAPASALDAVLTRIRIESGGNPSAINNWDINAKRGQASRGLMQTIPPTFTAYAGPFRGRGIFDPLANIYAGVNYAMHRYGSSWIRVMTRPGGYDDGGVLPAGYSTVFNGTRRPERVLTDRQWQALMQDRIGEPTTLEGDLYLDSGTFMGHVRGVVRAEQRQLTTVLTARRKG